MGPPRQCLDFLGADFRTARLSSVPGFDYEEAEAGAATKGRAHLGPTEAQRSQPGPETKPVIGDWEWILPKRLGEIADKFLVILDEAEGHATRVSPAMSGERLWRLGF
eukprot:Skav235772  [mRNA]  locus=scaffold1666:117245:118847:+ [translate_table: standard]